MYCRNCGKQIDNNAKVCPECGVDQRSTFNSVQGLSKSRIVVGVLGILFGTLGIHNFVLGYTGKGLAQLLITTLTCGVGGVIVWVWSLVESIQILTGEINEDAHGNPLTD